MPKGVPEATCGASRRSGDGQCGRPAGWGTDHPGIGRCRLHGGSTQNHKTHALNVQGQQELSKWGARRDISYPEAMLEVVQWKATEVEFWQGKVNSLADDDMTWGVTKEEEGAEVGSFSSSKEDRGLIGTKTTREAVPHIYIRLLHEAQRDLVAACTSAARIGVDAALISMAQTRAGVWLAAMRRMLADARVTVAGDPEDVLFETLQAMREVGA